jgi:[protein-PII] uridylyltransferase
MKKSKQQKRSILNLKLKKDLAQFKQDLGNSFSYDTNINSLTNQLVNYIDDIMLRLYQYYELDQNEKVCLLGIGSYGRRELQLYSDIDLLILHSEDVEDVTLKNLQNFIQDLWDIGLNISHQITTVKACAKLASKDVTVISSILDMRLICGRAILMELLAYQTHSSQMWPSRDYFTAKLNEQNERHLKYGESAYSLEPNIKNGPGGLRDIHVLVSIGKRHFGLKRLAEGIAHGFLTAKEYEELVLCQNFLWRVRFALHAIAQKEEDRLLFDYQKNLAQKLGLKDNEKSLGIEKLMKAYFQVVKRLREINEMLLQLFQEAIIEAPKQQITAISNEFQLANDTLEATGHNVFKDNPIALMELFLWLARMPQIRAVRASTIRLIHEHQYLIDDNFRNNQQVQQIFVELLKTSKNIFRELQLMNRYGVLGRYIPHFAAIIGQMQYDLFHIYTVDQHTLYVIRNIDRFKQQQYQKTFPLCTKVMTQIEHPEILTLAAFFHDIAKGRGGDHSQLGAKDAFEFAKLHQLDEYSCKLVSWLVSQHLLMSKTAQRQDIYDPQTIEQFCSHLPSPEYLDYLYLLTVADICATNPTLWNSWKDSLLRELYRASSSYFSRKQQKIDEKSVIQQKKQEALELLLEQNQDQKAIEKLWMDFKGKYFLHESPTIIARHSKAILNADTFPLLMIMPHHSQGGTELFIYMPHREDRFTKTTTILSNHEINILEARILTLRNGFDLDTYVILDKNNKTLLDENKINKLKQSLAYYLAEDSLMPSVIKRRISRRQAHFKIKPRISFSDEEKRSLLFLVAADRPGLLAVISRVIAACDIVLHNAKITTAGERVEDMFFITNMENNVLTQEQKELLSTRLIDALS